ncbi:hypothetical protein FFWV33_05005 [Flavobacterium faecale]|uniref:Uncharacterized protein n=1 Tax=Flavobacterium faecale TaxID=1355330 RepID=A0A2S1LB06_9FLAO|nr:hypothetical protein FFWV33_05005 [Flavobacterium faecale]
MVKYTEKVFLNGYQEILRGNGEFINHLSIVYCTSAEFLKQIRNERTYKHWKKRKFKIFD